LWNLPNESTSISDDDASLDKTSGSVAQEVAHVLEHLWLSVALMEEETLTKHWNPAFIVSTCKCCELFRSGQEQESDNNISEK
jgi:hypothetical protein